MNAVESTTPEMREKDSCACICCCPNRSWSWRRSVRRKLDPMETEGCGVLFQQPARSLMPSVDVLARIEVGNECSALRDALAGQEQTIQELCTELEEERNSSCTAANEAMLMIMRLQKEKAKIQMEAQQFKRFAEERMTHDQEEFLMIEDAFYKCDQTIQELSYEAQAYRHCLLSYGIDPDSELAVDVVSPCGTEINGEDIGGSGSNDAPVYDNSALDYPPLRCINIPGMDLKDDDVEFYKYAPGDTPRIPGKHDQLQRIEEQINQLDRNFRNNDHLDNISEKGVVLGSSPPICGHSRQFSIDSSSSLPIQILSEVDGRQGWNIPISTVQGLDAGRDDTSDRVYVIDGIYGAPKAPAAGTLDGCMSTPRDSMMIGSMAKEDAIKKLHMRIRALEADRESLKQTVMSMRTDSAQLVLLREIAQNLSKRMVQPVQLPEKSLSKKSYAVISLCCISLFKWIMPFLLQKKRADRCRYTFGSSSSNIGLLLVMDRSLKTPEISRAVLLSGIQR